MITKRDFISHAYTVIIFLKSTAIEKAYKSINIFANGHNIICPFLHKLALDTLGPEKIGNLNVKFNQLIMVLNSRVVLVFTLRLLIFSCAIICIVVAKTTARKYSPRTLGYVSVTSFRGAVVFVKSIDYNTV